MPVLIPDKCLRLSDAHIHARRSISAITIANPSVVENSAITAVPPDVLKLPNDGVDPTGDNFSIKELQSPSERLWQLRDPSEH